MVKNSTMKLKEILEVTGEFIELENGPVDIEISSIEYDSRKVKEDSLFVAVEGLQSDGHDYIKSAVANGAKCIIVSSSRIEEFLKLYPSGITFLKTNDTRRALSVVSASFFQFPSRTMTVIGVTGTNGKTSITFLLESIFKNAGYNPGIIGTVNYRWNNEELPAANTTPESRDMQELLYNMKKDGIDIVIMEVSSHALDLNRTDDVDFDVAVFTNLTRDHFDFHGNFENYFSAKKKIFQLLENSSKEKKVGIINIDDDYGMKIFEEKEDYSYQLKSFGLNEKSDYRPVIDSIENKITGLKYVIEKPLDGLSVELILSGTFHVYNSLAAVAVSDSIGLSTDEIRNGLGSIQSIPGRFEVLNSPEGFSVVIDYAHTGDALLKLLQSVNELNANRVITVFGCGGDRDRTKRPIMGQVAEQNSDKLIITSDNPRTEEPSAIIDEIVKGLDGKNFEVIVDRESAIKHAVSIGQEGDIIVIAGKGHEDYQILGTEKIHFDDREIAAKYMRLDAE